jgi:glycosyltransferase involved in cell wall biosynthesis
VIAVHEKGVLSQYLADQNVQCEVLSLPGFLHGGIGLRGYVRAASVVVPRIMRFLATHGIELTHGNDLRSNQTWSVATRLRGRPFVWHQRTKYARSRLTDLAMSTASVVVCISRFCRETLPAKVANRSIVLQDPFFVPPRIPERTASRLALLAEAGWSDDTLIIGFCGTLSRQKRPEVFIRAAGILAAQVPRPVGIAILGRDRDNRISELRALADDLDLGERVAFLGFRSQPLESLAAFDILLVPQFEDAFGRTLLEAMAVGTPVVASGSGGHLDLIRDGVDGLLCQQDDPDDMARCARRIIEDENIADRLRRSGRDRAGQFPILDHVRAIESLYYDLLKGRRV